MLAELALLPAGARVYPPADLHDRTLKESTQRDTPALGERAGAGEPIAKGPAADREHAVEPAQRLTNLVGVSKRGELPFSGSTTL